MKDFDKQSDMSKYEEWKKQALPSKRQLSWVTPVLIAGILFWASILLPLCASQ